MKDKQVSNFGSGLIWFGAAVSIAEILTGTLIAPLGFEKGVIAILLGHVIGCVLLYFAGLIGAKTKKSAMETVKGSFGQKGSILFSLLNIAQLLGWTAVMIIAGARAATVIIEAPLNIQGTTFWSITIGALILIWLLVGIKNSSKLNLFAMSALFLSTVVLSAVVFKGGSAAVIGNMSFGSAVELSVAMPLSWLPLISDYVKIAKQPQKAAAISTGVYFLTSCWMYIIGLGAAIFTGQSDIAQIMLQAGLGLIGVLIIVFSTVTTTFLDVYSTGVSFASITNKVRDKWIAIITCIIGTLLAIFIPIEQYQNFLYFIGSVFAPMTAILITDFFILKKDYSNQMVNLTNLVLWGIGFMIYRTFMSIDTVVGSTFPVMIIISILCILVNGGKIYVQKNSDKR
ncbi:MAG: putative hydroxymethylpyrimidine transporter CytX [Acetobacterium sp.]